MVMCWVGVDVCSVGYWLVVFFVLSGFFSCCVF